MKIPFPALGTCGLCAAAAVLAAGTAHATTLTLAGYLDTPDQVSGVLLASHDYDALIDRLAPHSAAYDSDEVASSTDLCVAYAATHRLQEARAACNEAVDVAEADPPGNTLEDHQEHQQAVDMALANQSAVDALGPSGP